MHTMSSIFFLVFSLVINGCAQPAATEPMRNHIEETNIETQLSPALQTATITYSKEELLGKFEPSKHASFVKIEVAHTDKPTIYLRREAYDSFRMMYDAAKKEGINIRIISATRNFDYQKGIWEKKWLREKYIGWSEVDKVRNILKYSSMPGTSRHHWGTDVDFNSVEPGWFAKGEGKKLYDWLIANGAAYGFAQTYTSKSHGRTGYEEEKWHWSYMPISRDMLKQYNATITYSDLTGFSGSTSAKAAQSIELYVNGIEAGLK